MAKYEAYCEDTEAKEIAKKLISKFPTLYGHINPDKIGFVMDLKKKSHTPIKVSSVKFPDSIWNDNVYTFIVYQDCWATLETKQRNLGVAQALCSIHQDGFSEQATGYGKLVKPNINTYLEIFAMAGGVPNWLENNQAVDPLA